MDGILVMLTGSRFRLLWSAFFLARPSSVFKGGGAQVIYSLCLFLQLLFSNGARAVSLLFGNL